MNIQDLQSFLNIYSLQNSSPKEKDNTAGALFQEILGNMLDSGSGAAGALGDKLGATLSVLENAFEKAENSVSSFTLPLPSAPLLSPVASQKESPASGGSFGEIIDKAASIYNIPAKLIKAVIQQESNFNSDAKSGAGAGGLMQLMPSTAQSLGVQDVFDPYENIMGGSKYLKQMLDQFGGSTELALAAYNAGPGNVKKFNGVPPFKETQHYVSNIMAHYNKA
ncbi:lytic transglycosylase domain-containing protein [Peribacillus kribbensis]|uniref:lytic transglycosylase domain-containing protein n=1 Tax=Peribacillus kribbensis TaxID=356658 RepID=UPI00042A2E26|nr:lytic transglycosylase domain-containing protein [Peribacillus kribbensis]